LLYLISYATSIVTIVDATAAVVVATMLQQLFWQLLQEC